MFVAQSDNTWAKVNAAKSQKTYFLLKTLIIFLNIT